MRLDRRFYAWYWRAMAACWRERIGGFWLPLYFRARSVLAWVIGR